MPLSSGDAVAMRRAVRVMRNTAKLLRVNGTVGLWDGVNELERQLNDRIREASVAELQSLAASLQPSQQSSAQTVADMSRIINRLRRG